MSSWRVLHTLKEKLGVAKLDLENKNRASAAEEQEKNEHKCLKAVYQTQETKEGTKTLELNSEVWDLDAFHGEIPAAQPDTMAYDAGGSSSQQLKPVVPEILVYDEAAPVAPEPGGIFGDSANGCIVASIFGELESDEFWDRVFRFKTTTSTALSWPSYM